MCAWKFRRDVPETLCTTIRWPDAPPLDNPYCRRLTAANVDGGMSPPAFFERLRELADGADAFYGYNVGFDMGCLRHHAAACGHPLPTVPDVDVMPAAARRMKQRRWPKLVDAYRALVGPPDEARAHDAEYDVFMTCAVLHALRPAWAAPPTDPARTAPCPP